MIDLHLLENVPPTPMCPFPIVGDNIVDKPHYKNAHVYINKKQYFEGVPEDVWEFRIGGYQVGEKWLKDRKGRKLNIDDIQHYQRIVRALSKTIRLMKTIDETIPSWPIE